MTFTGTQTERRMTWPFDPPTTLDSSPVAAILAIVVGLVMLCVIARLLARRGRR